MWIERPGKKSAFVRSLLSLEGQVLIVRGARQVGKTSFILDALAGLDKHPRINLNLLYPTSFKIGATEYFGRDFFGRAEDGSELLKNIAAQAGDPSRLEKPAIVFVDEADRHPPSLEAIQTLAEHSRHLKFVFTGSNLENIVVQNAATGRKIFFDLYPITFLEFVAASGEDKLAGILDGWSFSDKDTLSDFYHNRATEFYGLYLRIGGMPKIASAWLDGGEARRSLPEIVKDLAFSIEENVKTVLDEKSKLYEYEDILRKIALLSINTLKLSRLQVQHAGRAEAKKLVTKTVGARVAHKVRLLDPEKDLSKYILCDSGLVNYLLAGSDVLRSAIGEQGLAILHETCVGTGLIASLVTRDDLFYWKSGNRAEVDFLIRSPRLVGIDVKAEKGGVRSLDSFALFEPDAACLVKVSGERPKLERDHIAKLPNYDKTRNIPLLNLPHYLSYRLPALLDEI